MELVSCIPARSKERASFSNYAVNTAKEVVAHHLPAQIGIPRAGSCCADRLTLMHPSAGRQFAAWLPIAVPLLRWGPKASRIPVCTVAPTHWINGIAPRNSRRAHPGEENGGPWDCCQALDVEVPPPLSPSPKTSRRIDVQIDLPTLRARCWLPPAVHGAVWTLVSVRAQSEIRSFGPSVYS